MFVNIFCPPKGQGGVLDFRALQFFDVIPEFGTFYIYECALLLSKAGFFYKNCLIIFIIEWYNVLVCINISCVYRRYMLNSEMSIMSTPRIHFTIERIIQDSGKRSVYLYIYQAIYLSIKLSIYLSSYLYIYQAISTYIYQAI